MHNFCHSTGFGIDPIEPHSNNNLHLQAFCLNRFAALRWLEVGKRSVFGLTKT
jgi:hypothetical protein